MPGRVGRPLSPAGNWPFARYRRFLPAFRAHSSMSYVADKAENASEGDLHTWLRPVVKDTASLAHIEEMLGAQPRHH